MAWTRHRSQPLTDPAELEHELVKAHRRLREDPDAVPAEWISYAVRPHQVEFREGAPDRRHRRLSNTRDGQGWARTVLWP